MKEFLSIPINKNFPLLRISLEACLFNFFILLSNLAYLPTLYLYVKAHNGWFDIKQFEQLFVLASQLFIVMIAYCLYKFFSSNISKALLKWKKIVGKFHILGLSDFGWKNLKKIVGFKPTMVSNQSFLELNPHPLLLTNFTG